jgi:O-antigen ligase
LWSWVPLYSIGALWQIAFLPAICFCLGSQNHSLRPLFIGAGLGMACSAAVAVLQLAGWIHWPTINVPSGLFLNKNFMAEAAALVLIWLIVERVWWLAALVAPALALADARGALLALGVGLALQSWRRPSWLMGGLLVAEMVLFGYGMATHSAATTVERLDIWQESVDNLGFFGTGIGSYGFMPHQLHADGFSMHAHNDYLELVYELGLIGLGLWVLFMRELWGPLNSVRLVLIVFAVEACFAFPSHLPATMALAALAAGYAVRDGVVVRRVATHRRNFGNPGVAGAGL